MLHCTHTIVFETGLLTPSYHKLMLCHRAHKQKRSRLKSYRGGPAKTWTSFKVSLLLGFWLPLNAVLRASPKVLKHPPPPSSLPLVSQNILLQPSKPAYAYPPPNSHLLPYTCLLGVVAPKQLCSTCRCVSRSNKPITYI